MIEQQQKLVLSPYMEIYKLVVPKDNLLRQIKELVDFEFIYDELLDKYCLDNGRNAVPPIRMFKYLLLKAIYDLSDVHHLFFLSWYDNHDCRTRFISGMNLNLASFPENPFQPFIHIENADTAL